MQVFRFSTFRETTTCQLCHSHAIFMQENQNIENDIPAISLGLSTHRASNILGKTGYHVYK